MICSCGKRMRRRIPAPPGIDRRFDCRCGLAVFEINPGPVDAERRRLYDVILDTLGPQPAGAP